MAYSFGANIRILLIITVSSITCTDPPKPDHFWPLNSQTYGFDVKIHEETAVFFGENSIPAEDGFWLDGFSHVTINVRDSFNGAFTLDFSLWLDPDPQGILFQYRDDGGTVLLAAIMESSTIKLIVSTCSATLTSNKLSPGKPIQVALVFASDKLQIFLDKGSENCIPKKCKLSVPGELRFGAGFDETKSITGMISNVVLFGRSLEAKHIESSYHFVSSNQYKASEPKEQYKKGYFWLELRDSMPDSSSYTQATKHTHRRHGCASICLQYFYCKSFAMEKSGGGYKCYLYPTVHTTTVTRRNTLYYVARKLDH